MFVLGIQLYMYTPECFELGLKKKEREKSSDMENAQQLQLYISLLHHIILFSAL